MGWLRRNHSFLLSVVKAGIYIASIAISLFFILINPIHFWSSLIIIGLIYFGLEYIEIKGLFRPIKISNLVEELLKVMIIGIFGKGISVNYRSNVMIFDSWKKLLVPKFTHNMVQTDRGLTWKIGEGCCGTAFEQEKIEIADVVVYTHSDWIEDSQKIAKVWKEMKVVISIPLVRPKSEKVFGVMNVDTCETFEEANFVDQERTQAFLHYAKMLSDILGKLY